MASNTKIRSLTLLACLLTAVASGDDFSLTRLVFNPTSWAAETLPQDDPNTDFVRTTEAVLRNQAGKPRRGGVGRAAVCTTTTSSPLADCRTPLRTGHAVTACSPHAELNMPLRC